MVTTPLAIRSRVCDQLAGELGIPVQEPEGGAGDGRAGRRTRPMRKENNAVRDMPILGACLSIPREPRWLCKGADARRAAPAVVDSTAKPRNARRRPLQSNPSGPVGFAFISPLSPPHWVVPNLVGSASTEANPSRSRPRGILRQAPRLNEFSARDRTRSEAIRFLVCAYRRFKRRVSRPNPVVWLRARHRAAAPALYAELEVSFSGSCSISRRIAIIASQNRGRGVLFGASVSGVRSANIPVPAAEIRGGSVNP